MTFPEDRVQQAQPVKPPSYALGMLINILLVGSGFTYINRWPWHLGWLGILFVLNLLPALFLSTGTGMLLLLLPVAGWVAHLVHYHVSYRRAAQQGFLPPLQDGVKIALIVGHLALGFFMASVMSAVLLPNLLTARNRANEAAERAVAIRIMTQVMVDQTEGKTLTETCPTVENTMNLKITSCKVGLSDPENPTLDVTFESGNTVHLPRE